MSRWLALLLLISTPAYSHDWYHELRDEYGVKCCSDVEKECRPIEADYYSNGDWYIQVNGKFTKVPKEAVLKRGAPDKKCHACYHEYSGGVSIYCFIPCGLGS